MDESMVLHRECYFQGGQSSIFLTVAIRIFPRKGEKLVKFRFIHSKIKNIFAENLIGKCQISKYRRVKPLLCSSSDAHAAELRFQT